MLKLENIKFFYPENENKIIIDDLNLELNDKEIIGIIGRTGAGKSTLLQILAGILTPNEGKITASGKDIESEKDREWLIKNTGLVFQFPEKQLFEETVYKDIEFGVKATGKDNPDKIIKNAMEMIGLPPELFAERSPWHLSCGEQRKAAIAGIIAIQPNIVLFDEPSIGIDQIGVREIEKLLRNLKEAGNTVVIVSHNMDFIARNTDKIAVLQNGNIKHYDSKEKIFQNVDLLTKLDLDLPEIVKLTNELKNRFGLNFEGNYHIESVIAELKKN